MANARGKTVDTTYLSVTQAEKRGFLHRDYLAHCLRWSHVVSYLMKGHLYKTAHVLDVGCGREVPLARMMFSSRMTHTTGSYTGVDYGPIPHPDSITKETTKFNMELFEKTDFMKLKTDNVFDVITSFEVMEHVEPLHTYQMLARMAELLKPGTGRAFVSTPVYDEKVGAADNHVNEMGYSAFETLVRLAGFDVEQVNGTFASQKDYKKQMSAAQKEVFDELSEYYDTNVLSCFMAPMFPEHSRNCIWTLKVQSGGINELPKPHKEWFLNDTDNSNSDQWAEHAKKILNLAKKRSTEIPF